MFYTYTRSISNGPGQTQGRVGRGMPAVKGGEVVIQAKETRLRRYLPLTTQKEFIYLTPVLFPGG